MSLSPHICHHHPIDVSNTTYMSPTPHRCLQHPIDISITPYMSPLPHRCLQHHIYVSITNRCLHHQIDVYITTRNHHSLDFNLHILQTLQRLLPTILGSFISVNVDVRSLVMFGINRYGCDQVLRLFGKSIINCNQYF